MSYFDRSIYMIATHSSRESLITKQRLQLFRGNFCWPKCYPLQVTFKLREQNWYVTRAFFTIALSLNLIISLICFDSVILFLNAKLQRPHCHGLGFPSWTSDICRLSVGSDEKPSSRCHIKYWKNKPLDFYGHLILVCFK